MSKASQLARLINRLDDDYARRDGSSLTGDLVLAGAGIDPSHSADAVGAVNWAPADLPRGMSIARVNANATGYPAFPTAHVIMSVKPMDVTNKTYEIAVDVGSRQMKIRGHCVGDNTWTEWNTFINAANIADYALMRAANLEDVSNAGTARSNLGLGSAATQNDNRYLHAANNLSDVTNAGTARSSLGLESSATQDDDRYNHRSANLSDVANAATARSNLGLGSAATQDDDRYLHAASNLSDIGNAGTARSNLGVYSSGQVDAGLQSAANAINALGGTVAANTPAGTIFSYAGAAAPTGFLICDGAAVNRSTYAALFAAIGTTYGAGDESTTFNLPDLRGRAPIGAGQGADLTDRALGVKVGAETHTLTTDQIPAHRHLEGGYLKDNAGANEWAVPESGSRPGGYGGGQLARYYTDETGGGQAHNNMQPSIAVNFIIKT